MDDKTSRDEINFRDEIKEGIKLIQENRYLDPNIKKDEYAFNYWVLTNIYKLDESVCYDNITEYNDKGIDCFVHHEESKELYIIQNKYYGENTPLKREEVVDFLHTPITILNAGNYPKKRSKLQEIYNQAKNDNGYKIFLHLYVTNDKKNPTIEQAVQKRRKSKEDDIFIDLFYLSDLKEKFYGKEYTHNRLKVSLSLPVKRRALSILPGPHKLPKMKTIVYYVVAQVNEIYTIWKKAEEDDYPLFEENIRDYLGGDGKINKQIINTLKDEDERNDFFYYNNGITIICETVEEHKQKKKKQKTKIDIEDPQVVNGCQTVSSIAEVLRNYNDKEMKDEFSEVFVMTRILQIKKSERKRQKIL